jgi:prepilin-type N-terminal cleavage/methylation domain-containing protein
MEIGGTGMKVKKFNSRSGFTLIELLVALFILSIVITAFTALLSSSYANIFTAGRKSTALYEAQKKIETAISNGTTENETLRIIFDGVGREIKVTGKEYEVTETYEGKNLKITAFVLKN